MAAVGGVIAGLGGLAGGIMAGQDGGGYDVDYVQSPEQRAIMQAILPMFLGMYGDPQTLKYVPTYSTTMKGGLEGVNTAMAMPEADLKKISDAYRWTPEMQAWSDKHGYVLNPKYSYYNTWKKGIPTYQEAIDVFGLEGLQDIGLFPPHSEVTMTPQQEGAINQGVGETGTVPPQLGGTTGSPPNVPGMWNIPNIGNLMPQQGWYGSIDPSIRTAVMEPYIDASRQLTESLGYSAGSPQAGASGVLGGAQADFWSDAAKGIGPQAWNYMSPGLTAGWQAELQRNMFPYSLVSTLFGQSQATPVVTPSSGFNTQAALGGALAGGYAGYKGYQAFNPPQQQPNFNYYMPPAAYGGNSGFNYSIQNPFGYT